MYASFGAAAPTSLFALRIEADTQSASSSVVAHASSQTLEALRSRLAATATHNGFSTDWPGIPRRYLDRETTPMRIVLVADDRAYRPLDISAAVADFERGRIKERTFVVADGLSNERAAELVRRLTR